MALATDKSASEMMLNELRRSAERKRSGLEDPFEDHGKRPVSEHVEEFCDSLRSKNNTEKHVRTTRTRLENLFDECGFRRLIDLDRDKAGNWLRIERDAGRLAVQTSNYYIAALKQFGRWLLESERLARNPFAGMTKLNADVDRRVVRRALTDTELSLLIDASDRSKRDFRGLTGNDRSMLYMVAAFTGLRAGELGFLTVGSVNLDAGTVTVEASYSKRRRQDELPLHPSLVARLAPWLTSKRQRDSLPILSIRHGKGDPGNALKLWPGTWSERSAQMLRADLADSPKVWIEELPDGSPERLRREQSDFLSSVDADGRVFDFHGIRHTFCTRLAKSGISPKEAQTLARHSSITLTLDRYSHLQRLEIETAMNRLPELPRPAEAYVMTGTDDFTGCLLAGNCAKTCDSVTSIETTEGKSSGSADPALTACLMRPESDCER